MESDAYIRFQHTENYVYDKGWDKFAEEYNQLLKPYSIYYLTKEIAHKIVSEYLPDTDNLSILDINCGTGNDFPFFLAKGWKVCGCDGSPGMLNKAYEKYTDEINNGKVELFLGKLENLNETSFEHRKFDLIFSVTGGFSYINNEIFLNVNKTLSSYLKENGFLITAHLSNFCLPDTIYNLLQFKIKKAFIRLYKKLTINIKGENHRMFLRSQSELKRLIPPGSNFIKSYPLLAITPPYQTGYRPPKAMYNFHKWIELKILKINFLSKIADQIVMVYKRDKNSNSKQFIF